jgi:gas vesicle protein
MLSEITDQIKSLKKELLSENEKLQSSLSEEEKKKIKKKINDIKEDINNQEESYNDALKNGQKRIPQMIKELLDRSFIF